MVRRPRVPVATRLTEDERVVVEAIPLEIDVSRVHLYRSGSTGTRAWSRWLVLLVSRDRAVALGNHVFLPDRCCGDLAVLAHELTHCGQYQAWGPLVYFARGARTQLMDLLYRTFRLGSSPYRYRTEAGKPFQAYGMEQQAQIVEDRVRAGRDYPVPSA
jgi:hypothetical protein